MSSNNPEQWRDKLECRAVPRLSWEKGTERPLQAVPCCTTARAAITTASAAQVLLHQGAKSTRAAAGPRPDRAIEGR